MALGRRRERQGEIWVSADRLPRSAGHVFYRKLNELLAEAGFDEFVEELCRACYHQNQGRPSIPPGIYFRMLLIGYFEGIGSQRGIAWRCEDSLSLRAFLGVPLTEDPPVHSSLTRVRNRLPLEIHRQVFQFVLGVAAEKGLLAGKTVAVDATTLEANAAMKSIVRRDSGEDWNDYLKRLMQEEGLIDEDDEPTDEELRRFDKGRKNKKVSNEQWVSKTDPDSRVTRMKDGRTHLAYKAEHVIDAETELLLAAEVCEADNPDTNTMVDSVMEARTHLRELDGEAENEEAESKETERNSAELEEVETEQAKAEQVKSKTDKADDTDHKRVRIEEVVADKGYHSAENLELAEYVGLRTYIPESQRKHDRRWTDKDPELKRVVRNNRRRTRTDKNRKLQRLRGERVERSFAHVCDTGGARRSWLRGLDKVRKRYLITAAARNLGLVMRKLFNIGKPRGLQAREGTPSPTQLAWTTIQAILKTAQAAMNAIHRQQNAIRRHQAIQPNHDSIPTITT